MSVNISIGSIVSLETHPFVGSEQEVIISGDALTIPPIMVVIEKVNDSRDLFDEKTGRQQAFKGYSQCKCMWYSHLTAQFEEAWIHSKLLKLIDEGQDPTPLKGDFGELVAFSTLDIELKKKKSTLKIDVSNGQERFDRKSVTSLLSFVSPIMQVIQYTNIKEEDVKDPLFDSKTGVRKREISRVMVKCKWFNHISNKFSEKLIPHEALRVVSRIEPGILNNVRQAIDDSKYYKNTLRIGVLEPTIIKPVDIVFRSGRYFVHCHDFVKNKNVEIDLGYFNRFTLMHQFYRQEGPVFNPEYVDAYLERMSQEVIDLVKNADVDKLYLRIRYENKGGRKTTRTVSRYSIATQDEETPADRAYLRAYCHVKEKELMFKISRISQIELLDLSFE